VEGVQPYLDHALSHFGHRRLIFGTDWPVCTLAASYERVVDLAEQLLGGLSPDERAAVFGGNAADVYALDNKSKIGTR
jgi:L-fuconolactonase